VTVCSSLKAWENNCAYKFGWLCEQRRQFLRLRKERYKVIRGGVLDATVEEIMERMEVFENR
jgi:hypothetical protein